MIVAACAAADKLPPPGWTAPDESAQTVSLSDVSWGGESIYSQPLYHSRANYFALNRLGNTAFHRIAHSCIPIV